MNGGNAELLRRLMTALGMTGVALAKELTEVRADGKETGAATISRWLNGVSPVEPAVLLMLRERLRNTVRGAYEQATRPMLPAGTSAVVGVASAASGLGATTVATGLAIVAREAGMRASYHSTDGINARVGDGLERLGIAVRAESNAAVAEGEVMFVDGACVPSAPQATERKQPQAFDLIVVPADFGDSTDAAAARRLVDASPAAPWALLHYPRKGVDMSFARVAHEQGFDVSGSTFVPFAFPQSRTPGGAGFPLAKGRAWRHPDQQRLFSDLLWDVLRRLGMAERPRMRSPREIDGWDLERLLDEGGG